MKFTLPTVPQRWLWAVSFLVFSLVFAVRKPSLFHPRDVLPLLPSKISWPILRNLKNATELLPTYMGSAKDANVLEWEGKCFKNTTVWLEYHNKTGSAFGGGTLHITTMDPATLVCSDLYIFTSPYRWTWESCILSGSDTYEIDEWGSEPEYRYMQDTGIAIFLWDPGFGPTLRTLGDVLPFLSTTTVSEDRNIEFLKENMKAEFTKRSGPLTTEIIESEVHSGDMLMISKIRGRWGAFQTLQKWVTGTFAGHTAVFLKDNEGQLFVAESGHADWYDGEIVVIKPWKEWWQIQLDDTDSNPHIAILPLSTVFRETFNGPAAWMYAKSMDRSPYGFHNLLFGWIDTEDQNYPRELHAQLVHTFLHIGNYFFKGKITSIVLEALNKRLDTKGLDLPGIIREIDERGTTLAKVMAIPENDYWYYSDGPSVTCVAFVIQIYKHAGMFADDIVKSIQATEFTVRDAYMLRRFERNISRLPTWCNNELEPVKLPFCQILGNYRMELPGFNTIIPYANMNENCPSLPPNYERPEKC